MIAVMARVWAHRRRPRSSRPAPVTVHGDRDRNGRLASSPLPGLPDPTGRGERSLGATLNPIRSPWVVVRSMPRLMTAGPPLGLLPEAYLRRLMVAGAGLRLNRNHPPAGEPHEGRARAVVASAEDPCAKAGLARQDDGALHERALVGRLVGHRGCPFLGRGPIAASISAARAACSSSPSVRYRVGVSGATQCSPGPSV